MRTGISSKKRESLKTLARKKKKEKRGVGGGGGGGRRASRPRKGGGAPLIKSKFKDLWGRRKMHSFTTAILQTHPEGSTETSRHP